MLRERRICGLGWAGRKSFEGKHRNFVEGHIPRGNGVGVWERGEGREGGGQEAVYHSVV